MNVARRLVRRVRRGDLQTIQRLRNAQSVLFVCTGNINRSVVAHSRMQSLCEVTRKINVASAGLIRKAGRSTSDISKEVAQELNLDLSSHRSSILTCEMLDDADIIVVMEASHLRDVVRTNVAALKKTYLLSAFDPMNGEVDIHDPFSGNRETFRVAYNRVVRSVDELANAVWGEAVSDQCESINELTSDITNGHCVTSNSSST